MVFVIAVVALAIVVVVVEPLSVEIVVVTNDFGVLIEAVF